MSPWCSSSLRARASAVHSYKAARSYRLYTRCLLSQCGPRHLWASIETRAGLVVECCFIVCLLTGPPPSLAKTQWLFAAGLAPVGLPLPLGQASALPDAEWSARNDPRHQCFGRAAAGCRCGTSSGNAATCRLVASAMAPAAGECAQSRHSTWAKHNRTPGCVGCCGARRDTQFITLHAVSDQGAVAAASKASAPSCHNRAELAAPRRTAAVPLPTFAGTLRRLPAACSSKLDVLLLGAPHNRPCQTGLSTGSAPRA